MTKRRHSKKTTYLEVRKNFSPQEIDIADLIMQRMGSFETKMAFANEIKTLYLYAARDVLNHLEKNFQIISRW